MGAVVWQSLNKIDRIVAKAFSGQWYPLPQQTLIFCCCGCSWSSGPKRVDDIWIDGYGNLCCMDCSICCPSRLAGILECETGVLEIEVGILEPEARGLRWGSWMLGS